MDGKDGELMTTRQLTLDDLGEVVDLAFVAFADAALPSSYSALQEYDTIQYIAQFELSSPFVYGIGVTFKSKLVAMAFVKKVDITALDLVLVHPAYQNRKIGKHLLSLINAYVKDDFSVRMLADATDNKTCALFSSFGMEFKEIVTLLTADDDFVVDLSLLSRANTDYVVRPMTEQDISYCSSLHVIVNNFPRVLEMAMAMKDKLALPHVLERNGVIVGYTCGFTYTGHTCCLDKTDFYILLAHYKFINKHAYSKTNFLSKFHLFLPANVYPDILTNCLKMGMKIAKLCVMMVRGAYYPPREGCVYTQSIIW